jgi:oxygen-independent coproporphyrinogen III oxidase
MNSSSLAGLYIHIPFCVKKCSYCDFYSVPSPGLIPDFIEALFREIEMAGDRFGPVDTVYFGGGTPSLLTPQQVERIITRVRTRFKLRPVAEITLEANPGDLSGPSLKDLRAAGVNRLSLGVQSFNPRILEFLGRRHSAAEASSAVELARAAGFRNLGLDLIYAIPGQTTEDWMDSLARAVQFAPEHLSCYELSPAKSTPLGRKIAGGEIRLYGEDSQHEFFMRTSEFLENSGYLHYEISNFSRGPRYFSRHNQKYWNHTPYLGLGPSAHSFFGTRRWWNDSTIEGYLGQLSAGRLPVAGSEVLTDEQLRLEAVYLGLRTRRGLSLEDLRKNHRYDLLSEKKEEISAFRKAGFLILRKGRLRPTRAGMAVADRLALM